MRLERPALPEGAIAWIDPDWSDHRGLLDLIAARDRQISGARAVQRSAGAARLVNEARPRGDQHEPQPVAPGQRLAQIPYREPGKDHQRHHLLDGLELGRRRLRGLDVGVGGMARGAPWPS